MVNQNNNSLDEKDGLIHFDSRNDNRDFAIELANDTECTLRILTPDMENTIYDNTSFIQAITKLILKNRHSKIHVLIKEPSRTIKKGHRLIETARKFSSYIHLHNPLEEDRDFHDAFIVADEIAYIYKQNSERYEGVANFHGPLRAKKLIKRFDAIWQKSQPDPEMRGLHI